MKVTIHGHEMDITEPADGGMVLDVVVLARVIRITPESTRPEESLIIDNTEHTTLMVQRGIIDAADQASLMDWSETEG